MPVFCLGFHIGHDRGASLIKNGTIVAAIAEERLDRVKHSKGEFLPLLSIKYVLKEASIEANLLDLIVFTHSGRTPLRV